MGIHFQNVGFKYNPFASRRLVNVSLDINSTDEFVFVLGRTGSGKSTLVQNMNALLLPLEGQITVFDKNVVNRYRHPYKLNTKKNRARFNFESNGKLLCKSNIPQYSEKLRFLRKHIGLVFQFPEYQLFEATVLKDVAFGPKNFGMSDEEAESEARKALKLVGLGEEFFERSPFMLSGGQMRRVAIAGILAINPDIIILDEPTVGLDPKGKDDLMNLLTTIQRDTHKSIIMISHDMNVVARHAKRIIVMENGNKVYDGPKRELFEDIERLRKFNLDLPSTAELAVKLKEKGLINYTHLPLYKEELETVLLGGDIYE